jgi:hypothetical protein
MNEAIKKLWVEALRSGKYEQGHEQLKCDGKHCCLGVLCELHATSTGQGEFVPNADSWGTDVYRVGEEQDEALPPLPVVQWAGLRNQDPGMGAEVLPSDIIEAVRAYSEEPSLARTSLSAVNDAGATFAQIADLIEKAL